VQLEPVNYCRKLTLKAAFIVAFFVPFFSSADISDFAELKPPDMEVCDEWSYSKYSINTTTCSAEGFQIGAAEEAAIAYLSGSYAIESCTFQQWNANSETYKRPQFACTYDTDKTISTDINASFVEVSDSRICPNIPEYPEHTYPVLGDVDGEQKVIGCAKPADLNLNDSCNSASGNSVLNIQVTDAVGCFTQSDGSVCKYNAVDVGGGNSVYQMDLEGDCYSETYPTLDDNGSIGELPVDGECTTSGNLLTCPANPDDVCDSDGTNCQEGCGYVNDVFACYDTDTDSDGLPDYDDPDIDGDGIKNEDDLDSDGDGKDDPISDGDGDTNSTVVNIDMSGLEDGIGELGEKMTYTTTTQPIDRTKFDEMFGDAQTAALEAEIVQLKADVKAEISTIRSEASAMFTITAAAGGYEARNLVLTKGTFDMSLSRFSYFFKLLAAPVMLICSLIAAFVLLGGKR